MNYELKKPHVLTLNRLISNRSFTIGRLTADDDKTVKIYTMEARLPLGEQKYRFRLLPPGEYPVSCIVANVLVGSETFRGEWPQIDRVKFYTKASFINYTDKFIPYAGAIFIGNRMVNEFSLADADGAELTLLNYCRGKLGDPMQLRIVEDRSAIEFHDYTREDYLAELARQIEQRRLKALEEQIYSLSSKQSDTI